MRPILTLRHYTQAPIDHSHDHAQLVFGLSGHLDFEVEGRGSQVRESSVMVLPFSAHHACGSRDGSRCLVLDVPTEHWVLQSLGEHADASRRLLDQPARLALDSRQHQLVQWLANSPVDDPLIVQQGAVLLLASLNHSQAPQVTSRRLPYAAFNAHIERHVAHPLQVADLARRRLVVAQLLVVLDLGGQVAGGGAAVGPVRGLQRLAALAQLLGRQHLGNAQHHGRAI